MITDEQIRLFSQYCSENFGTELKSVRKSERYQSLPICVLDCVYSLRTKYFAVTVPVLQRYADTYIWEVICTLGRIHYLISLLT